MMSTTLDHLPVFPNLPGALCQETDPEIFYPEQGESPELAQRVCRSCPVRDECLEFALEHDERFGVWGGLSARQRHKLQREHPRPASPPPPPPRPVPIFGRGEKSSAAHAQQRAWFAEHGTDYAGVRAWAIAQGRDDVPRSSLLSHALRAAYAAAHAAGDAEVPA